ncbi:MAG: hypothetical protein CBD09_00545 [Puniceicoccaceae bacterium TMED149]|nr:MAG: hypothetical protein CBD09_00545 [Puniceicoccaceae bacterium TMED149]|tara:strand:- start:647 stop:958 length:312 start_codon:yes stop_codon:yes gene_type:complete
MKYTLIEHKNAEEQWAVMLSEGKYEGLVYKYGKIDFHESDDQEVASLSFEYDVLEPIDIDVENLTGEDYEEFKTMIGDILVELIEASIDYHENRNDNTEASDQ